MAVTYVGSLSVGGAVPGLMVALTAVVGDLQDQLAAALAFEAELSVAPPPSIGAQIALCQAMLANLTLLASLGIEPPSLDVQISLTADLIADLRAKLEALVALEQASAAIGLHAYAYSGAVGTLGADFTTALAGGLPGGGGPLATCNAILLATDVPATWTALSAVVKVTP